MIVGRPGIAFRARRTEGQLREQPEVTVYSRSREDAEEVIEAFESEFAPKDQRAVDCLVDDSDKLLTPRDSPAELRTTNVIESPLPHGAAAPAGDQGEGCRTNDQGYRGGLQAARRGPGRDGAGSMKPRTARVQRAPSERKEGGHTRDDSGGATAVA
jgi:hypothetical protein